MRLIAFAFDHVVAAARKLADVQTRADYRRLERMFVEAHERAHRAERARDAAATAGDLAIRERDAAIDRARIADGRHEAELADLRERLRAEREVGTKALLELAARDGKVPAYEADPRRLDRLRRIARASGLAALEAELDEYPMHFADCDAPHDEDRAAGTNPVTSKRTS